MGTYFKLKVNGEVMEKRYARIRDAMNDARAEFRRNPGCPGADIYEVECRLALTMTNKGFADADA